MWTRSWCNNDVRGRGLTAPSRKNRYEWVVIHETWPIQKVQSKNTLSSSDCTTMILTTLWSTSHECVHGRYTDWSPPPYVIITSTHSRDEWSQAFPVFRALPLSCIILNANLRTKNNGVGMGTRLILAVKWTDNAVMLQCFHRIALLYLP